MALVPTVFETAFRALIQVKPASALAASNAIADAYQAYAASAQAGVATPVFTGTEKTRFASTLYAALQNTNGSAAAAAVAFVAALTTFWLTPPVIFGAGAVTSFAGAAICQASLLSYFSAFHDTTTAPQLLAQILDVATRTVTVQIGPNSFTLS